MRTDRIKRRRFANFSYFGLLDSEFRVIWAEDTVLFRRLSNGSKKLLIELRKNQHRTYNHIFISDGKYYRAKIDWTNNNNYVCRVSPEIPETDLDKPQLLEFVDGIKDSVLDMYSYERMLEYYAETTKYVFDKFHFECKKQKYKAGSIYSDCFNILNAFEGELNSEFIPLHHYLLRTWDVIQFATRGLKHSFSLSFDLIFPCIKIDYSKFELALYNLVKLALIYPPEHCAPVITIETVDMNRLEVRTTFPIYTNVELKRCEIEIRAIKHLFKLMNGEFVIYQEDGGMLTAKGNFEIEVSADENDIATDRKLKFVATPEIIEERSRTRERYRRIYENDFNQRNHRRQLKFASEERELDDIADANRRFAEIFFSKAYLMEAGDDLADYDFT